MISKDFYVDDLLTGTDCLLSAITLRNQVSNILKTACFELRKWAANNSDILKTDDEIVDEHYLHKLGDSDDVKTFKQMF